ncbi:LysM peptidoglycan-binding domain-containing protein [Ruficoccus sp. ZRK36]|uniref:muramidase family protein n=1 Tax=Ruficoccus sp. ZRK36 TaxID=2866311 RepID=UPI001C738E9B|nr:LysM peptidoglycan-binding domain-containing protein [Ruficoccus sp. ZRK36]QYY35777.1 LysM peptidoglycan-binding domain-containing protein [Ruficoccus sp. ZRK36]
MRKNWRKVVMKISQIFLCVIGLHLAVIAFLFATPGCNSGPEPETTGSEGVVGPPEETVVSEANENYRQEQYTVGGTPIKSESTTQVTRPRYEPTRPSWNLNQQQPAEVIEGTEEVAVLEPVDASGAPATAASSTYIVKKGDNLTTIARANDLTLSELMDANGLNRKSVLQVGQVLVIPGSSAASFEPPMNDLSGGAAASADVAAKTYKVKPGDNLSTLAKRNGTTVNAIKSANNLSSNTIYVGQELLIPAGGASYSAPSASSSSASVPEGSYLVKKGDTLGAIAKRYDVKVSALMTANGISDPRSLRAGQTLVIPGVGGNPAPSAPAPTPAPRAPSSPAAAVPAPAPAPQVAPSQPAVIEEYNADALLLENLDDIPAAEVQSTN